MDLFQRTHQFEEHRSNIPIFSVRIHCFPHSINQSHNANFIWILSWLWRIVSPHRHRLSFVVLSSRYLSFPARHEHPINKSFRLINSVRCPPCAPPHHRHKSRPYECLSGIYAVAGGAYVLYIYIFHSQWYAECLHLHPSIVVPTTCVEPTFRPNKDEDGFNGCLCPQQTAHNIIRMCRRWCCGKPSATEPNISWDGVFMLEPIQSLLGLSILNSICSQNISWNTIFYCGIIAILLTLSRTSWMLRKRYKLQPRSLNGYHSIIISIGRARQQHWERKRHRFSRRAFHAKYLLGDSKPDILCILHANRWLWCSARHKQRKWIVSYSSAWRADVDSNSALTSFVYYTNTESSINVSSYFPHSVVSSLRSAHIVEQIGRRSRRH